MRASVVAGKRNKTRKSTSEAGHKPRQTGETVPKSVSGFFENETNVSSSDEDDEIQVSGSQMNGSPRHVVAPSARFESAIFIGRDDITPEAEKTHILTALPGMIYEVRDRFSGSDFWYVKVLGESEEGQKREGWIKARHLKPYQGTDTAYLRPFWLPVALLPNSRNSVCTFQLHSQHANLQSYTSCRRRLLGNTACVLHLTMLHGICSIQYIILTQFLRCVTIIIQLTCIGME